MTYSSAEPGPGKYNDLCTHAMDQSGARVAIVIILGGHKGDGISVQAMGGISDGATAELLRITADAIERGGRA